MRASKGMDVCKVLKEEGVNPQICGVLAVNVQSLSLKRHVAASNAATSTDTSSVFCELSYRNFTKRTRPGNHERSITRWNQMLFVPVNVVLLHSHPFNKVKLTVYRRQYLLGGRQRTTAVGTVVFHLHEMVKGSPTFGEFPITEALRQVGHIRLEVYFTYGSLGFGHSIQLLSNGSQSEAFPLNTMLPRFLPPARRTHRGSKTMTYDPFAHLPKFTCAVFSTKEQNVAEDALTVRTLNQLREDDGEATESFPLLTEKLYFLKDLQKELLAFSANERIPRLVFLHKQVVDGSSSSNKRVQNYLRKTQEYKRGASNVSRKYFVSVNALVAEEQRQ